MMLKNCSSSRNSRQRAGHFDGESVGGDSDRGRSRPVFGDRLIRAGAKSYGQQTTALDRQQGKIPSCVGSGVDVGPVCQDLGTANRRVTMNDVFAEVFLTAEKLLADPQQVCFLLLPQGYTGPDTGMNEEEVSTGERQTQALQKFEMLRRQRGGQLPYQGMLFLVVRFRRR